MGHIALGMSLFFSAWLLVKDSGRRKGVSLAVWVPTLLLMILSSRHPTQWITGGIVTVSEMGNEAGGSALDAGFFFITISASFVIAT